MSKITYKLPKDGRIGAEEIFDMVLKDTSFLYGLQEFSEEILKYLEAFERESKLNNAKGVV